jgi:hypothetical protein
MRALRLRRPAARRSAGGPRRPGEDWLSKAVRAFVGALVELFKLAREMLVIPTQLWLAAAEAIGAAVLAGWDRLVVPALGAAARLVAAAYRVALREVTPLRALGVVAAAALIGLAASQWVDLSSVSVGNDDYAPGVQEVAPAPEVDAERAGDAHAWVMVPIAVAGLVALGFAFAGRHWATRLLIAAGIAAIAISVAIDAPQGLDEGSAALAYEGAEARLLEGFWIQVACGAVLIAAGLMLPRRLRSARAQAPTRTDRSRRHRDWPAAPAEGARG